MPQVQSLDRLILAANRIATAGIAPLFSKSDNPIRFLYESEIWSMPQEVRASIVFGHTKREMLVSAHSILATEWADCPTRDEQVKHAGAAEFISHLACVPVLTQPTVAAFRGRRIAGGHPSSNQMGPPPLGTTLPVGRYNKTSQCVLYLCDSEAGVRQELYAGGDPLYIMRFALPTSTLRIADFTTFPIDHFLTAAFAQAELCECDHRRRDGYRFSNVLAELVAGHFHGMRVRGARGEANTQYNNIIVFEPYPYWSRWLRPGDLPYESPA